MLRTRFVYAILASLAVIALGAVYQAVRPEATPETPAPAALPADAPAADETPAADAGTEPAAPEAP